MIFFRKYLSFNRNFKQTHTLTYIQDTTCFDCWWWEGPMAPLDFYQPALLQMCLQCSVPPSVYKWLNDCSVKHFGVRRNLIRHYKFRPFTYFLCLIFHHKTLKHYKPVCRQINNHNQCQFCASLLD